MEKRKKRRLLGRSVGIVIGVGLLALIGLGFVPKPVQVVLGKAERRSLEVTVDEPGKTRIRSKYVISAPSAGQLSRIALQAGDRVAENQVVAELTPVAPQLLDARTRAEATARVNVAQANVARTKAVIQRAESTLSFARDQATRSRTLHAQHGTSQQALEKAEYDERAAKEELANAQLGEKVAQGELEAARAVLASMSGEKSDARVTLSAPVAGPVLRVFQESAGVVQAGAPLLEVGDPNTLEITVDVLSMDAVRITKGALAHIERWGGPYALEARVREKQPAAFTTRSALGVEEQRVPVMLDLVDPRDRWRELGDSYRVEARIRVAYIENALVAPNSALFRDNGGYSAFVVEQGKARKRAVEIGARTPDWAEVKSGLKEGEVLVLYPSDTVVDGVGVTE